METCSGMGHCNKELAHKATPMEKRFLQIGTTVKRVYICPTCYHVKLVEDQPLWAGKSASPSA